MQGLLMLLAVFGFASFFGILIAVGKNRERMDSELQERHQRNLQNLQNSMTHTADLSMRSGLDQIVDDALGTSNCTPDFEKEGPTEAYLRYFQATHPCPHEDDHMTIVELELSLQHYMEAEQELRLMVPDYMNYPLRMRYVNALLKLYIMTGRTELALEVFTKYQDFSEQYLMTESKGILSYLDNAATVTALAGDFDEAERYCEAMKYYIIQQNITDMGYLLPYITKVKLLFMEEKSAEAEALFTETKRQIQNFQSYRSAWNQTFLYDLLDQTRLFDASAMPNSVLDEEMPEIVFPASTAQESKQDGSNEMPTLQI